MGGAHAFVHTASRYDDCQLVQLPLSHLTVSLEWLCRSTPQCHHDVIRCVPGKLPELPEGQVRVLSCMLPPPLPLFSSSFSFSFFSFPFSEIIIFCLFILFSVYMYCLFTCIVHVSHGHSNMTHTHCFGLTT